MPGRTREDYTNEVESGWFARCEVEAPTILTDICADQNVSSEAIAPYTVAPGPAGLIRTA